MMSLFNVLALAAVSQAYVVTETAFETHWQTVYANGHQHTEAKVATVSVETSTAPSFPATTTVAIPQPTGSLTLVLTLNSEGKGYALPSTLAPEQSSEVAFLTALAQETSAEPTSTSAPAATSSEAAVNNFQYSAPLTSEEPSSTEVASSTSEAAPSSSSTGSSSGDLDGLAKECTDFHNKVRADHQAGSVTWDDNLASYAANYLNGNCNFAHSGGPYGENIAMGYSSATAAMQAWYDENKDYDYSAGQFGENTGHFTQMVWKGTSKIGCAQTSCGSSGYYLACEYSDERGNIIGYFTENVFPKSS